MQNDLVSISRVFTESLYRIPDYQRGYSWRLKQLREFWGDLEQLDANKNHYTGVLTLEEVSSRDYEKWDDDRWIIQSKRYVPYFVVDGQQRLTTVVVLLQCIIERIGENERVNYTSKDEIRRKYIFESKDQGISRSYLFGYQKDNPSAEFLKTEIFMEASEKHRPLEDTIYTYNLQQAKEFFREKLSGLSLHEVEAYYTKVTQNLLFNIYTMSSDIDVFVAFETMNNRGKPLSHLEILKNRLIYISTKFEVDQEEKSKLREVVNNCWKAAYNYLGKNKENPLNDNDFLLAHFFLHFGREILSDSGERSVRISIWRYGRDDYYKDYLLNEVFNTKALRATEEGGTRRLTVKYVYGYAHDLKASVKKYYEIANPDDSRFSPEEKVWLQRLSRLAARDLVPLTLAVFMREKDKGVRVKYLERWERILFLKNLTYSRAYEDVEPIEVAIKVRHGEMDVGELVEQLDRMTAAVLKEVDLKATLGEWVKRRGYYGWSRAKYFYFEYEEYLRSQAKTKRKKLDWSDFAREDFEADFSTIEHIYPQKADTLEWRSAFSKYSVKERNVLRNSLGNLVALSRSKNSSLGRKNFADKKRNGENTVGYSYGCYSENEIAIQAEWTATQVVLRGLRLLHFMERRWGISLGTNKEKLAVLGLEFCLAKEDGLAEAVAKVKL